MLKEAVTREVEKTLENSGYTICEYTGCFDVVAKKDKLLLLKILQNIDSFSEEQAKNLKIIANNLEATAILIGENTTREKLKDGIVYERFEIPCITPKTLDSLIAHEIFPKMYRDKGGLYVEIDSAVLKETREKKKLTQRELAEMVGINKKVIYEHEKKELRMILDIAQKLEGILNKKMIKPVDVLAVSRGEIQTHPKDVLEKDVGSKLSKIGFKIDYVKQAPFDVFAKEKTMIVSDVESNKRKMKKRAAELRGFIHTVEKPAVMITEESKEENVEGIPVIKRKDLKELSSKEVVKIAKKAKK
ncbi:MAG: helix-turn-helix domain-containing protein [Candidatus Aenigmarchaeota archaeon]|nr:helix-turn-helix domain-containing protein [Candidatus Aenigmarchaeota archaeon]